MSVNKNTIKKFKRLFDAEMKAHNKYTAGLNVLFAGYSEAQEESVRRNNKAASDRIYAEFKKYNFTEEQWDELLSECGYFDCGWEYEVMKEDD